MKLSEALNMCEERLMKLNNRRNHMIHKKYHGKDFRATERMIKRETESYLTLFKVYRKEGDISF